MLGFSLILPSMPSHRFTISCTFMKTKRTSLAAHVTLLAMPLHLHAITYTWVANGLPGDLTGIPRNWFSLAVPVLDPLNTSLGFGAGAVPSVSFTSPLSANSLTINSIGYQFSGQTLSLGDGGVINSAGNTSVFTNAIGEVLSIEGTTQSGPDFSTFQPQLTLELSVGQVLIRWGWQGYARFLDMIEIWVKHGTGWQTLAYDTTPGYTDTTHNPPPPLCGSSRPSSATATSAFASGAPRSASPSPHDSRSNLEALPSDLSVIRLSGTKRRHPTSPVL